VRRQSLADVLFHLRDIPVQSFDPQQHPQQRAVVRGDEAV
jgi:hypothetical protein